MTGHVPIFLLLTTLSCLCSLFPACHLPAGEKHMPVPLSCSCCTSAQEASLPSLHQPPLNLHTHFPGSLPRGPPSALQESPRVSVCISVCIALYHLHLHMCLYSSLYWQFLTGRNHGNVLFVFVFRIGFRSKSSKCINLYMVCLILLYHFLLAKHCANYPIDFYN